MFDPKKLFKPKTGRQEITSLNLQAPSRPGPDLEKLAADLRLAKEQCEAFKGTPLAEDANRRAQKLLDSGKQPEAMFYVNHPTLNIPLGFTHPTGEESCVLIFSSPILAIQFARTMKAPFQIMGFQLQSMDDLARQWQLKKFKSFIFDLTPTKRNFPIIQVEDGLISKDRLVKSWAGSRVTRELLAEVWYLEFLAKPASGESVNSPERLQRQRKALEDLRDFGASDVPFVHWMIAMIARIQGDEDAKRAAQAALEDFGPFFSPKETQPADQPCLDALPDSLAVALLGLMTEFGLLKQPDGTPAPPILRQGPFTITNSSTETIH